MCMVIHHISVGSNFTYATPTKPNTFKPVGMVGYPNRTLCGGVMGLNDHRLRESKIEKKITKYAKDNNWITFKFKSPGQKSVPDRIFFRPTRRIFFIEFKAPGEEPNGTQKLIHGSLRMCGFEVHIVDNIGSGMRIIDKESAQNLN